MITSLTARLTRRKFVVECMDLVLYTTIITKQFPIKPMNTTMAYRTANTISTVSMEYFLKSRTEELSVMAILPESSAGKFSMLFTSHAQFVSDAVSPFSRLPKIDSVK